MNVFGTLFGSELREGELKNLPRLLDGCFPCGKFLVLTEEAEGVALGEALKRLPKKLTLVLKPDEDLLPLFHAPDGVTCVVGAGSATEAARYFACVRSLPFVAVCLSCAPAGLTRNQVRVRIGGERIVYPVRPPALIFTDTERMAKDGKGVSQAFAYLSAAELARFSFAASQALSLPAEATAETLESLLSSATGFLAAYSESYPEPSVCFAPPGKSFSTASLPDSPSAFPLAATDARLLFQSVLTAEYCFSAGFPESEVFRFAFAVKEIFRRRGEKNAKGNGFEMNGESPRESGGLLFSCVLSLVRLYKLFFESGFYRGGKVDYNARSEKAKALAAGTEIAVGRIYIPTAEELKNRAEKFESNRAWLLERLCKLEAEIEKFVPVFEPFKEKNDEKAFGEILRLLPELSLTPNGIAALMRDFSLL